MKATKPKIIALLIGILVIGTTSLYIAKFLAKSSGKSSLKSLVSTGIELFEKERYKDAVKKLEDCYQKAPEGDLKNQALLYISRCYGAQDEHEKAAEFWGKVVENPAMATHHAEAFYSLASLRSAGGTPDDMQAAEEYYRKAADVGSGSRFGHLAEIGIAKLMLDKGNIRGARLILEKLQDEKKDYPQLRNATFKLHMKLLFSPILTKVPESQQYAVKEGDTLDGIARTFGTTADLLEESNGVNPLRLQIGKKLKVVTGKFSLKVSKSKNILQLVGGDMAFNEYRIGTGKFGSTPAGRFTIAEKQKEPPWFRDGRVIPYGHPENVLGTRWMGFESPDGESGPTADGLGIHGTDDESSIGKESSEGCIRLLNRDVEELYKIVPIGTEVLVEE